MTTKHGALFDLDGVLIDSEGIYTEFWSDIARGYDCACQISKCATPEEFAMHIKGNTLENILSTYFPFNDIRQAIIKHLRTHELTMEYRIFDGVYELLEQLQTYDIPAAIVTSSNGIKMKHMCEQLPKLAQYFKAIITGDDVSASKPDPQGYIKAARAIGCQPLHCCVFEDSLAGIEAGHRAGCRVIGLTTTLSPECIAAAHPDIIVHSLANVSISALY